MRTLSIPGDMVFSFIREMASRRGVLKNVLIQISGGLGDIVCVEPSIRFALQTHTDTEFSVMTTTPELFTHLPLKAVYHSDNPPDLNEFFVWHSMTPTTHLQWEFLSPMQMHCVDYSSISLMKIQLPNARKFVTLPDFEPVNESVKEILRDPSKTIVLHAGKGYLSKTFPVEFWDQVIEGLKGIGFKVALIGKTIEPDESTKYPGGFVATTVEPDLDLRDKISLKDLVALLKGAHFLLSNDSSPIHIAAAGDCHIGMIATLKRDDYLTHWRHGTFGWRTKNFGHGCAEDHLNFAQNQTTQVELYEMPKEILESILPDPSEILQFYRDQFNALYV